VCIAHAPTKSNEKLRNERTKSALPIGVDVLSD
jgi:hypothetical protein